ncbi:ABC transporter ATP-binding protein [Sulfurospirillum barnesii]|uniref:ABC-type multidrug transport system, ATPase and permease component n=1 Tax=Sulfurospirillum barnesii (strain ATCC 700032 / DSM 10660 / SES-3) TaxID=760154 RepID=I3XWB8_SULBS|nr:ABC transporter ATP-binding protein [Sulfurospirillum barnesii]AFL68242.1 ABC-type multidrug transport system, ATPase and permease component [Sulfurospirillum barnesii SES-3]
MHTHYTFKTLFHAIKQYQKELILANMIALFAVMIHTPVPLLMPMLVDEVLLKQSGFLTTHIDALFGQASPAYVYIMIVLVIVIALRVCFFLLNYMQTKLFTIVSKNIAFKMREHVLAHLSKVAMNQFEFFGSGKVASLMVTDIETIDNFLGVFVSRLIISLLSIIGVGAVLLMIHWQLALFILILNPIVILLTTKMAKKVAKLKKEQNSAFELFQESLLEALEMFVQIRATNKEKLFFDRVQESARRIKERSIIFGYKSDGANRLSFLIFLSGFELFRAASIFVVAYSDLSIGSMLAIFGYLWVMMPSIQDILNIQYSYHNAQKALDRINEILSLKAEEKGLHVKNPFAQNKTNAIELKGVSFSYDDSKQILEDINMSIPRGAKIAIIGASGSGKTTLAHLLVGLYPLTQGDILIDGISTQEIGLDVVRDHVFLVLQNPQLFNASLAQNLMIDEKTDKALVQKALHIAQLESFIEELPFGLDTQIGKHGLKLSGGQRQRLSIARMVLQNPNIVVLDESTSALDVHTEAKLFGALEAYLESKTTIIIAHRLSTIKKADYIYVLDKGKILESGTHEQLMREEGAFFNYKRLS